MPAVLEGLVRAPPVTVRTSSPEDATPRAAAFGEARDLPEFAKVHWGSDRPDVVVARLPTQACHSADAVRILFSTGALARDFPGDPSGVPVDSTVRRKFSAKNGRPG
jgi:hypothetical protein